jgi:hypothetical protein
MHDDPVGFALLEYEIPRFGRGVWCVLLEDLPRSHPFPHNGPDNRAHQQHHHIEHAVKERVYRPQLATLYRKDQPQKKCVVDTAVGDGIDDLICCIAHYPWEEELVALDADEAWYHECDEKKQFVGLPNIHYCPGRACRYRDSVPSRDMSHKAGFTARHASLNNRSRTGH